MPDLQLAGVGAPPLKTQLQYLADVCFFMLNKIIYKVDYVRSNNIALKKYCRNAFSQLANVSLTQQSTFCGRHLINRRQPSRSNKL